MKDEIIIYGVKYKKVVDKYQKTFKGDYYSFKVSRNCITIEDCAKKKTIATLIESISALKEALKYMEEK